MRPVTANVNVNANMGNVQGRGVQLSDLQQILSSLPSQPVAAAPRMTRGPSLQQVLDSRALEESIINMSEEVENSLREYLPEGHTSKQDMINLIHSPQFQQALSRFDSVLHSEDVLSIFYQCGLEWNANDLQGSSEWIGDSVLKLSRLDRKYLFELDFV